MEEGDFSEFDLIVAMDQSNLETLRRMENALDESQRGAELRLMMEFSPRFQHIREVPDPYYGGTRDFVYMCELLEEATEGLLRHLEQGAPREDGREQGIG